MTQAADIVVKKNDNTTNVTYTLVKAAGGEGDPAVWRDNSSAGYPGQKTTFTVSAKFNSQRTARRVQGTLRMNEVFTDTTKNITGVRSTALANFDVVLPTDFSTATAAELSAQFGGLLYSTIMRAVNSDGYAPV